MSVGNILSKIGCLLVVFLMACGQKPVANPVIVDDQNLVKTREEKIQNILDNLSISSEKNDDGIYYIFTVHWDFLGDLLSAGESLFLERSDKNGVLELAILKNGDVSYKDHQVQPIIDLTYKYRLKAVLSSTTLFSKSHVEVITTRDPFSIPPNAPAEVFDNGEKKMLERYLNGFKIRWIDRSNNDLKFIITRCVLVNIDVTSPYSQYPEYITQCVDLGGIQIPSSDPTYEGESEYFDSDILPSIEMDPNLGEYCYSIYAVNDKGSSRNLDTECRKL